MAAGDTGSLPFSCAFVRGIPFYFKILVSFELIVLFTLITLKLLSPGICKTLLSLHLASMVVLLV